MVLVHYKASIVIMGLFKEHLENFYTMNRAWNLQEIDDGVGN